MNELREGDRRILELRLQGMTQDEVAREVGCTERTVRRTLDRIKSVAEGKQIREQLMTSRRTDYFKSSSANSSTFSPADLLFECRTLSNTTCA